MAGRKKLPDDVKMKLRSHYFNDVEYTQLEKQAQSKGLSVEDMFRKDYKLSK